MHKSLKLPVLDFLSLQALASRPQNANNATPCSCAASDSAGWISLPASLNDSDFQEVGTLLQDPFAEPCFDEYHPSGTRYDSPDAPIAPHYFPCNRCTVSVCNTCGRAYLRYTEAGGYFVDRRIRWLNPALLVDV